jgi:hypothetical protein
MFSTAHKRQKVNRYVQKQNAKSLGDWHINKKHITGNCRYHKQPKPTWNIQLTSMSWLSLGTPTTDYSSIQLAGS